MLYIKSLKINQRILSLPRVFFKPNVNIFIVFLSIISSPFVSIGPFQPWQICSILILILNLNIKISDIKPIYNFIPLLVYVSIYFLISINIDKNKIDTISKFILFSSVYLAFLILIITGRKYINNKKDFIYILNTILLIVTIYGTYQFVARQFNWPFTFDEILRFRKYKVAGFYQASSFFEEPAFFSQFLITGLFIHLFLLKFKYKMIVLLMTLNILFTLSVAGIVSFFIILFVYSISIIPKRLRIEVSRRKIFRMLFVTGFLLILIVIVMNSQIPSYVRSRVKRSFVSDTYKEYLEEQSKIKGRGIAYDVSGYLRITNEIKTFNDVFFSKNILWGYGINYQDSLPERKMALNTITEIMVRWGLIGLLLFLIPLFNVINSSSNKYGTIMFFVLMFFIDGAIAKLVFWFLVALIIIALDTFKTRSDVVYNRSSL